MLNVEFRDTAVGRTAFIEGTGLAVWEIMMILRAYEGDAAKTAAHLCIPESLVQAAINYRNSHSEEVDAELADNDSYDFEKLKRLLPEIELIEVDL